MKSKNLAQDFVPLNVLIFIYLLEVQLFCGQQFSSCIHITYCTVILKVDYFYMLLHSYCSIQGFLKPQTNAEWAMEFCLFIIKSKGVQDAGKTTKVKLLFLLLRDSSKCFSVLGTTIQNLILISNVNVLYLQHLAPYIFTLIPWSQGICCWWIEFVSLVFSWV